MCVDEKQIVEGVGRRNEKVAAIGREGKKAVAADVRFDKSNNVPPRQSCNITVVWWRVAQWFVSPQRQVDWRNDFERSFLAAFWGSSRWQAGPLYFRSSGGGGLLLLPLLLRCKRLDKAG